MLAYDRNTGLVSPARQVASPNCDERPDPDDIGLIVIHGISLPPGEFGGPHVDELFTNCLDPKAHPYFAEISDLRVSTHLFIRRDGELVQYVPLHWRAWHAGVSSFRGRERCNDYSVGIELEGTDDTRYTDEQYDRLVAVVALLIRSFPGLDESTIAGHSGIAPGRKTDPGECFDWARFRRLLGDTLRAFVSS